jgi:hypothetical protein
MPLRALLWLASFAMFALAVASYGQADHTAFDGTGADDAVAADGLSFTVRTASGATRFRQGNAITLELAFVNRGAHTYSLDTSSWPLLGFDAIVIEPSVARADWEGGWGFVGSGLGNGSVPLTSKGAIVAVDVNEAWRFGRPGRYQLFVRSIRVAPEPMRQPRDRVPLVSNTIELEIQPQAPPLDAGALAAAPARALRFLDTPQGTAELAARLLRGEDNANLIGSDAYECARGLVGSSHHAFIVPVMEEMLAAAEGSVSRGFVYTLAQLTAMLEYPAVDDAGGSIGVQRQAAYERALDRYTALALATARRGSPEDRALALAAWLDHAGAAGGRAAQAESVDAAAIGELVQLFDRLPDERQWMLLNERWRWLATPAVVPVLERILHASTTADSRLIDIALIRLSELSADEARRIARRDIERTRGRFTTDALVSVLDPISVASPAFDALLLERLRAAIVRSDTGRAGPLDASDEAWSLVARYGTPGVAGDVLQIYQTHEVPSCRSQTAILSYLLRAVPDTGVRLLDAALSGSPLAGCAQQVLDDLARFRPDPILEEVAIAHLSDVDPVVAASAANALRIVGTDTGRAALWQALERWHGEWKDPRGVLAQSALGPTPADAQWMFVRALREALMQAVNWRASASDVQRLEALCLDESCRLELRGGVP